jgi:preprotein translocase SecE subunit
MAAEAVATTSKWRDFVTFVRESFHEIRHKTTWPELAQVRQASIAIIIFVLLIGLFITLLDTVLHALLVRLLPTLFR